MAKFNKFQSGTQYYFRLRADNNEIVLSSEGYQSAQGRDAGIASVKVNASNSARYQKRDAYLNYTFNLTGQNGEIIGRSENYTTSANRDHGIEVVKTEAPNASVD
jgi:uncharacterized protein YegP (UPF0339 family)